MRILIVHNHYQDFGGEDVVFEQESKVLSEQAHVSVFKLSFQNKKGLEGLIQFLLLPWNFIAARKLRQAIQEVKPDIIHIHNTQYACGPILIRTAKKMGIPVVMTLHNFRLLCPSATLFHNGEIFLDSVSQQFPWTAVKKSVLDNSFLKTLWTAFSFWLHRRIGTWNMVGRYFVLTKFAKSLFLKSTFGISESKFVVKPNFAGNATLSPATTERKNYFLYVGRLSIEKGIVPFLETAQYLDFNIVVAGDGPERKKVEEIAQRSNHIHYLGFQDNEKIRSLMSASIAVIVPSICLEGMPLSILEAYSMGTPVVANDLGALPELIKSNDTGFLMNIKKPESIDDALSRLRDCDLEKHRNIVENCLRLYNERFHPDITLRQLLSTYRELIDPNINP